MVKSNKTKIIFFILIMVLITVFCFSSCKDFRLLSKDMSIYVKDANEYDNIVKMDTTTEIDGLLYYIHPKSNYLYQYNAQGDDILIKNCKMDFMIFDNRSIYYVYDDQLFSVNIDSDMPNMISSINNRANKIIKTADNLFFIKQKQTMWL